MTQRCCTTCENNASLSLKTDVMGQWIETAWIPERPDQNWQTVFTSDVCVDKRVLDKFDPAFALPDGYTFAGTESIDCPAVVRVNGLCEKQLTTHSGAFVYRFANGDTAGPVDVLVMAAYYNDDGYLVCLACMSEALVPVWDAFEDECARLSRPQSRVMVLGGNTQSFEPNVDWDDIILPAQLKADLLEDVQSFFDKGVAVYQRLKLKPFRKLLLAGVPGTGKTMLCNALAKWALDRAYQVIYVSSGDREGSKFWKIQYALNVAARSNTPCLIILEELDAYLHEEEKALILNVLDGSESIENKLGTLLIATTNYPEAIDERVLKRPGRLDRIYIIPEIRRQDEAGRMLRQYLGDMWHDDHLQIAKKLVGYPGAFVREVAVFALTQLAYDDGTALSLSLLQESFDRLRAQIKARDDFLTKQTNGHKAPTGFGRQGALN